MLNVRIPDMQFWKDMVPCQAACPVHTDAGRYVQLIAEGRVREAYLTARSPNPLASICGRICAAPCEDSCRRGLIDAPVSIRALKRVVTERYGVESQSPDTLDGLFDGTPDPGNAWSPDHPSQLRERHAAGTGPMVAVIGSGPAGLACAHDLALMGYRVTVFEASGEAGGMLRYGIPEYRLPRSLIEKEVRTITELGAVIRFHTPLTADFGVEHLKRQGYQAVFISVGTQRGRDLTVPGNDLDGVVRAIDYLLNINRGFRMDLGRRVLVIGGGFVAFDAARTALRGGPQEPDGDLHAAVDAARSALRGGADEVHIASLESFAEMPVLRTAQGEEEFEEAIREGVQFHPQRGPHRFTGVQGRVTHVDLIGVDRTYDGDGRFSPVYNGSVTERLEVDSVVLAIGQQTDLSFLRPADGIQLRGGNLIQVDPATLATSAPGVFAGGDVAYGPRNVIDAVANGKLAARSIEAHLTGRKRESAFTLNVEKISTRTYHRPDNYERIPRCAPPTIATERRTGITEVESAYESGEALRQAERCLACHVQTVYDADRCVMCNRCVDVCPEYCLKLVPFDELALDEETRGSLTAHFRLEAGTPASAMVKDDESCIRCGLCAIRCPTDAMTMEIFTYEQREPGSPHYQEAQQ